MKLMMFKKALVVSVLVITFVQCNVVPLRNHRVADVDFRSQWLDIIFEKVEKRAERCISELNQALDKLKKSVSDLTEKGSEEINSLEAKFKEEFDDIKKHAEKFEIDMTKCVKDEQKLIDTTEDIFQKIVKCGETQVDEGEKIVEETIATIKGAVNDVEVLGKAYEECSDKSSQIEVVMCRLNVIRKATIEGLRATVKISKDVYDAVEFVDNLEENVAKCIFGVIAEARTEGEQILKDVAKCTFQ